jgi:hypothetical protein
MKTCFSGGADLAAALGQGSRQRLAADAGTFNEGDHPRDETGKFAAEAAATKASGVHHGAEAARHEDEAAKWRGRGMHGVAQQHQNASASHGSASSDYHKASEYYARGDEGRAIKHHDRADGTAERVERFADQNRLGVKKAPARRFDD